MPKRSVNLRRGFVSECERKSEALRAEMGISKFDPLDAFDLANHLNIPVVSLSELPLSIESLDALRGLLTENIQWFGMALPCSDGVKRVFYNDSVSSQRTQSDIMHEIAHFLCEHSEGEPETSPFGFPVRKHDKIQEEEAKRMGGILQLPRCALLWCNKKEYSYQDIAVRFNASVSMVRYRQNISGATFISRQ